MQTEKFIRRNKGRGQFYSHVYAMMWGEYAHTASRKRIKRQGSKKVRQFNKTVCRILD